MHAATPTQGQEYEGDSAPASAPEQIASSPWGAIPLHQGTAHYPSLGGVGDIDSEYPEPGQPASMWSVGLDTSADEQEEAELQAALQVTIH